METFSAIAQIIILYFVIYAILKEAKGSRFGQALMGVGVLVVLLAAFTYLFDFHVLSLLVKYLLIYFAISTVVIFQPEIRRFLTAMGAIGNLEKRSQRDASILTPEALIEIILTLSEKKLGALFAFEQAISLRGYEASGTPVDAIMTEELLVSIFTPPLPLHDGGAVVRNGRLSSAHCLFPISHNPSLASSGMRHRAAVGISEETDALVIVVSEETGSVSIAHNGKIMRYSGSVIAPALEQWLEKYLPNDNSSRGFWQKKFLAIQNAILKMTKARREK